MLTATARFVVQSERSMIGRDIVARGTDAGRVVVKLAEPVKGPVNWIALLAIVCEYNIMPHRWQSMIMGASVMMFVCVCARARARARVCVCVFVCVSTVTPVLRPGGSCRYGVQLYFSHPAESSACRQYSMVCRVRTNLPLSPHVQCSTTNSVSSSSSTEQQDMH